MMQRADEEIAALSGLPDDLVAIQDRMGEDARQSGQQLSGVCSAAFAGQSALDAIRQQRVAPLFRVAR